MARPPQTILDYLVVAICPILIGLMVGSFAYFLLECTYVGVYDAKVRWITGCFIVATVGIARISIEMGSGRAIIYGGFLLFVVILAIDQLSSDSVPLFFMIVALTWFGIHKLTWSCTFIDEQEEDVGRGLLELDTPETSGASKASTASKTSEVSKKRETPKATETTAGADAHKAWYATKVSGDPEASEALEEDVAEEVAVRPSLLRRGYKRIAGFLSEKEKRTHPPGVWIIYFAIVAIPIFTIAQWMIPAEQQERAIGYVTVCLFSGMGLLVATSLLGLRRYLRHRNVPMSGLTSTAWVTLGAILIVVCVGFAMLMPRPTGTVSDRMAALRESFTFKEKPTKASRNARSRDAAEENPDRLKGQGENRTSSDEPGEASEYPKNGSPKSPKGNASAGSKDTTSDNPPSTGQGQKSGSGQEGSQGDRTSDPKGTGDRSRSTGSTPQHTTTPPAPRGFSLAKGLVLLRWAVIVVVAVVILVAVWRNRRELLAALREILQAIRDFWANLFGGSTSADGKRRKKKRAKAKEAVEPRLRFIDMVDPFGSGQAGQMRPQELVKYTFEAIETWAVDRDAARGENETPREFLLRVEQKTRIPTESLRMLSEAYARTTYDMLPETDQTRATLLDHLGTIWRSMRGGVA